MQNGQVVLPFNSPGAAATTVSPNFQLQAPAVTFSEIMKQRYLQTKLEDIPALDKEDLLNESPLFNSNFDAVNEAGLHQATPEFAQSSYLRLRSQEEAYLISNYLDPKSQSSTKPAAQRFVPCTTCKSPNCKGTKRISRLPVGSESIITPIDRSYAIQKLYDLHLQKEYRPETLFTAQQIMDRYLYCIGYKTFPKQHLCRLATISMLIAAKLEQPISPSFNRMISLLTDDERMDVTKKNLVTLESDILVKLGFDFNFPGPM